MIVILAIAMAASGAVGQTTAPAKRPATGTGAAAADTTHYDGFVITAKRSVKIADEIPVFVVGGASGGAMTVLSVEAAEGATDPSEAKPWFAAFPEATTLRDRNDAIEAWRIEKGYVKSALPGTSFAGTISMKVKPFATNKAFACSFVQEEGEVFAAFTSEGGAKSKNTMPVADGSNEVQYPFMATLKISDGNLMTVLPALLRANADMRNHASILTISPSTAKPNDAPTTDSALIPESARSSLWCKKEGSYYQYLRFYSAGTVIEVTSTGAPSEEWFNESYKSSGKYHINSSSLKFSIGTFDYDGVVQGTTLQLNVRSPINNEPAELERYEQCQ